VLEKGTIVFEYIFLTYCMETTFYEIICECNILEYSTLKDDYRDFIVSKDRMVLIAVFSLCTQNSNKISLAIYS